LGDYRRIKECFPVPNTNIANHVKIRKGDMAKGWAESEVIAKESFFLPQSDHIAMETCSVRAEIKPDGHVIIHSPSQGPYIIRKKLSRHFGIDIGKITVHTPIVGGAFGESQINIGIQSIFINYSLHYGEICGGYNRI
jgi:CO/xanthine dehydrogenase Mo-binding subunit